jgi:hypothetical protein
MQTPPLDPDVADTAPSSAVLTTYDQEHLVTYLRLLDAATEGADWREVARIVLHLDPEHEADRARRAFESHLARARWMARLATGNCYAVARPLLTFVGADDRRRHQRRTACYRRGLTLARRLLRSSRKPKFRQRVKKACKTKSQPFWSKPTAAGD